MGKTIKGQKGEGTQGDVNHRPPVEIDMDQLIECCKHLCTKEETAAICRVSCDTIERRLIDMGTSWLEFYEQYSSDGKMSLRRALYDGALGRRRKKDGTIEDVEPSTTAQIWLSKQHLGMKDRNEVGFDPERPAKFVMSMGKKLNNGENDDD